MERDDVSSRCNAIEECYEFLLAYAGQGRYVVRRVDLSALVQENSARVAGSLNKDIVLELRLANDARTGKFAFGDTPTLADCCLVPQLYSAARFGVDLAPYPRIVAAGEAARTLPQVAAAHPDRQPDADSP